MTVGTRLIMERGGAVPFGELRHHCATSEDALYIIGSSDLCVDEGPGGSGVLIMG
jgi:hypothetical protein